MGQFIKKVAFFGLVGVSSSGFAQAQSPWRWPNRSSTSAKGDADIWRTLPSSGTNDAKIVTASALVGPSDFVFPPIDDERAPSAVGSPPAAGGRQPASFDFGRDLPPEFRSPATPAAIVNQVAWDTLGSAESPTGLELAGPESQSRHQPRSVDLPWEVDTGDKHQDSSLVSAGWNSGVIGPMDMVPPLPAPESSRPVPASEPTVEVQLSSTPPFAGSNPNRSTVPIMVEPDPLNLLPLQVSHEARHSKPQELPEVVSGEQFSHSYVLESVRLPRENAVVPQTIIPIEVIPFNRLVNDSKQLEGINKTYSAAAMTGPLTDPRDLFSKLNIDNDFRAQPAQAGGSIRTSSDAFSYGAEWMPVSYAWVTPTFYHRPLYFEQVNLERYGIGQKRWIQPFSSAAHFFGSIGLMPYKLLTQHPGEHVYTLGHQRPGDCVAFQRKSLIGQSYPLEALRYFDDYSGYR